MNNRIAKELIRIANELVCAGNNKNHSQKKSSKRSISEIADEIRRDWKNVHYTARPYLEAMFSLNSINDKYMFDSGRTIVRYFLSNASGWKGETAKRIKAELMKMLKR